jgi:EAL domain-containing protein (putative c-di-GMP-specific phosphodiesterase class I)
MRLHSVSLYNTDADVLWLSEGALGPDEHNVVIEAIELQKAEKSQAYFEIGMEDGRMAVFLPIRGPRGDLAGTVMILADLKSLNEGTMERIVTQQIRTVLVKIAMFMRKSVPASPEATQDVVMPANGVPAPVNLTSTTVIEKLPAAAASAVAAAAAAAAAAPPLGPREVEQILELELIAEPPRAVPTAGAGSPAAAGGASAPAGAGTALRKNRPGAEAAGAASSKPGARAAGAANGFASGASAPAARGVPTLSPVPASSKGMQAKGFAAVGPEMPARGDEVLQFDANISIPTAKAASTPSAPPADVEVLAFEPDVTVSPARATVSPSAEIEVLAFDAEPPVIAAAVLPPQNVPVAKAAPVVPVAPPVVTPPAAPIAAAPATAPPPAPIAAAAPVVVAPPPVVPAAPPVAKAAPSAPPLVVPPSAPVAAPAAAPTAAPIAAAAAPAVMAAPPVVPAAPPIAKAAPSAPPAAPSTPAPTSTGSTSSVRAFSDLSGATGNTSSVRAFKVTSAVLPPLPTPAAKSAAPPASAQAVTPASAPTPTATSSGSTSSVRAFSDAPAITAKAASPSTAQTAALPVVTSDDEDSQLINDTGNMPKVLDAKLPDHTSIEPAPQLPPLEPMSVEESATDLTLFAQELIKLRSSGRTRRYEVLARSQRDAHRNEVPAAFVADSARGKEGSALDALVMERLLTWLGKHGEAIWDSEPASFSVNLSLGAIEDEAFPQRIQEWLDKNNVPAEYVGFEITESACVQSKLAVQRFVDAIEKMGCFLVIDNFSLDSDVFEFLGSKALRHVKLDPKLTAAAMKDKLPQALVVAILQACKVLGVHCVAKKVESQSSMQWLTAVGCDFAQSFSLHKPLPLESLATGQPIKALRE